MIRFSNGQRNVLGGLLVFCLIVAIYSFASEPLFPRSSKPNVVSPPSRSDNVSEDRCSTHPVPPDTVVIVKTGANEVYGKLPTQLLTSLHCYTDLLFFSDLAHQLGPYTIHDALANVSESIKTNNPQFEYYRTLQEYHKNGQDIGSMHDQTVTDAWDLDKFKFIHMLEKTWALKPNRKWYIYIEADTYLVQANLRLWLERLDSSKPWYIGSPTYWDNQAFAHGGSGFILSGRALSKFAEGDPGIAARYDKMIETEKYGDFVMMKALKAKGVNLKTAWPMLNAEKPSTLPFGRGPDNGVRHWCQPIVTMHHITPAEASQIWEFEQQKDDVSKPILLRDLYAGIVASEVHAERDDWDNLSDDRKYRAPGVNGDRQKPENEMTPVEKEAYMSFEHCKKACEEQDRCYQFLYSDQTCGFSYSYRLGRKRMPDGDGKSYKAGWALERITTDQSAYPCDSPWWLP